MKRLVLRHATRGIAIFAALAILAPLATAQMWNADGRTDDQVNLAVESELLISDEVAAHRIDVETQDGIVEMTGRVNHLLAKQRAEELAMSIKGVRSVVNRIEVAAPIRTDDAIREEIMQSFLYDPVTESFELDATVKDGKATLTGKVESWAEHQVAEDVAATVRGVREIDNRIEVTWDDTRSDLEIEQDVKARLEHSVWVDHHMMDVSVENGVVKITGTAGSAREKTRARSMARVPGVKSVDDSGLEVEWWAKEEMRRERRYAKPADSAIADAVKDAYVHDPRLLSFEPEVSVENGIVTLTGRVDNLQAKMAAEEDAMNTRGVWMVRNHLRVRSTDYRSDDAIEADVEKALHRDAYLMVHDLDAVVLNGHVHLYGEVDNSFEALRAKNIAASADGVAAVTEHLAERAETLTLTDYQLENEIEERLFWNPLIDSSKVHVDVEAGVVTLTGEVDNWFEWTLADDVAARNGTLVVVNRLELSEENGS